MIRFSDEFNSYQHMSLIEWIFLFDESQERCPFHHPVLEVFSMMCVCPEKKGLNGLTGLEKNARSWE